MSIRRPPAWSLALASAILLGSSGCAELRSDGRPNAPATGQSINSRPDVSPIAASDPKGKKTMGYRLGRPIYQNPLASPADVEGWRLEGDAAVTFPNGRMRMENRLDPSLGQAANFVFWCPRDLPDNVAVSWDFYPIREPGLCILFFAAKGRQGQDLFDSSLARRTGQYNQYHSGDINALHVSYFRRKFETERSFHTCNLRKSHGFHLVCQGADPLPDAEDARPPYRIQLVKLGPRVEFVINDLPIFAWVDDGQAYGPVLGGGKIGFRQMAPLVAEYANLTVHEVTVEPRESKEPE